MIEHNGILIKNIYYMLSYAFSSLKQNNYERIKKEEFNNAENLFAEILVKGISMQLKQGLHKEYNLINDNLSVNRGKININGTIKNKLERKRLLACEFDELSENNIFNQILKTAAIQLIYQPSVDKKRKAELRKLLLYFKYIDIIDYKIIKWETLNYRSNNHNYRMLINICYFIFESLLLTTEEGEYRTPSFMDEKRMSRLFEKFVLEYYKEHYPKLKPKPKEIKWQTDDNIIEFLPKMTTDITLSYCEKTLIIDTKLWGKSMQSNRFNDNVTHHNSNLYQIFTYVKNVSAEINGDVSGLLLYAKTQDHSLNKMDYEMSGNKISVNFIDLNQDFDYIRKNLNEIVEKFVE